MSNQPNEALEKTRLIILHKLQTRKTYDPSHYPTKEHLYADLIANHIHENFTLKQSGEEKTNQVSDPKSNEELRKEIENIKPHSWSPTLKEMLPDTTIDQLLALFESEKERAVKSMLEKCKDEAPKPNVQNDAYYFHIGWAVTKELEAISATKTKGEN